VPWGASALFQALGKPKRRKRAANNDEKRSQESFEKRMKSRKKIQKKILPKFENKRAP